MVAGIGGERQPVVVAETSAGEYLPDFMPDVALDSAETDFELMDASEILAGKLPRNESVVVLTSSHANARGEMRAALDALDAAGADNPVILRRDYRGISADEARLRAAVDLGSLIIDGYSDGIMIGGDALSCSRHACALPTRNTFHVPAADAPCLTSRPRLRRLRLPHRGSKD